MLEIPDQIAIKSVSQISSESLNFWKIDYIWIYGVIKNETFLLEASKGGLDSRKHGTDSAVTDVMLTVVDSHPWRL